MKILLAGGTGFVGRYCIQQWHKQYEIMVVSRYPEKHADLLSLVKLINWDQLCDRGVSDIDVIINLSGASVGEGRWTPKRKKIMLQSRVQATDLLVDLCVSLGSSAPLLINASGVGIYGLQPSDIKALPPSMDESHVVSDDPDDFMVQLARDWEGACQPAIDAGVRVICARLGMVVGPGGGALRQLALPVRWGVGGIVAGGCQPLSWVSIEDVRRAFEWMMVAQHQLQGPVNVVSPGCVNHYTFMKMLGSVLKRPVVFPIPAWVMRLMKGEMADALIIHGQHVVPKRLLDSGFTFTHADLKSGLTFSLC